MSHLSRRRAGLIAAIVVAWSPAVLSAPVETPSQTVTATDETALCSTFSSEWKTAEASCSANANLGRARSLAREAELKCKSPEAPQRKIGVSKYQSALRLCRKPASTP